MMMARNVYFDPFGNYTSGVQAGLRDGMGLERGVRDARQMDYNFDVTQPLQTRQLQNEVDFQDFYQPLRRQASQYGLDRARFATGREGMDFAKQATQLTGAVDPMLNILRQFYGIDSVRGADGGMGYFDMGNPDAATQGNFSAYDSDYVRTLHDAAVREQAMQQAAFNRQTDVDAISAQNAQTQRMHAQNALMRQMQQLNQQGFNPGSYDWYTGQ